MYVYTYTIGRSRLKFVDTCVTYAGSHNKPKIYALEANVRVFDVSHIHSTSERQTRQRLPYYPIRPSLPRDTQSTSVRTAYYESARDSLIRLFMYIMPQNTA